MFRQVFKNKKTNENELLWQCWNNGKQSYFKDVTLTQEVDISDYDRVENDKMVVKLPTPYQLFGIECGRGWFPLLKPIIDYIDEYNKDKTESNMLYITQIKEKYGSLRFYVNFFTPELGKLIDDAEKESEVVCEMCGTRKNVGSTLGWYITICHDCVKKMSFDSDNTIKWHCYDDGNVYWINPDKEDEFIETYEQYKKDMP